MNSTPPLSHERKKKNQSLSKLVLLAGALGLEPRTKVLETHVLPLHHTPMSPRDFYIIAYFTIYVKHILKNSCRKFQLRYELA